MKGRFMEQLRELYRKTRIRIQIVLPSILHASAGILRGGAQIAALCAAVLIVCALLQRIGSISALMELVELLLVTPAVCAMLTYASDALWEKRHVTLTDAAHLVRIRAKQIFITGAAAWLIVTLLRGVLGMLLTLVTVVLGSIFALLSMIPIIGVVFAAIAAAAQWLITLLVEYVCHIALTVGMLVLIADGVSGRAQFDRAVNMLKSGGKKFWEALVLILGVWIAVGAAGELLALIVPAADSVVMAVLSVCSTTALSVVYLRQRDGVDFR